MLVAVKKGKYQYSGVRFLNRILFPLFVVLSLLFFELLSSDSIVAEQVNAAGPGYFISVLYADSLVEADSLIALPDSVSLDTMDLLDLEEESILFLEHTRINPSAAKIRADNQRKLPPDLRIRLTEETDLGGEYYFALVRQGLTEVEGRNNLYTVSDGNLPSMAYAVSLPIINAIVDYRTRNIFRSTYEAEMYADTLKNRFRTRVEVVLFLKSYDVQLLELEKKELFDIYIDARGDFVRPLKIIPAPIRSRVSGSDTWFERRITIIFPRLSGGVDFWSDFEVNLVLHPKHKGLQIGENERIRFNLVPD